jgi:hypothetical protein
LKVFSNSITAFVFATILTAGLSFGSSLCVATEEITQLNTSSGLLVLRKVIGSECPDADFVGCSALYLNEKLLFADHRLVEPVVPNRNRRF